VDELSRADCMCHLRSAHIGRLAVSMEALPVIEPVNFAVVDGNIIIRTTARTRFAAAATDAVVAFEVDGVDPVHPGGWSVLVQGVAEKVTDPPESGWLQQVPGASWPVVDTQFLCISTRVLSGRGDTTVAAAR